MFIQKLIINIYKSSARHIHCSKMAKSKYEYVKQFETEDKLLPNCWIIIRIDGKGFHKFANCHNFEKPNDQRALELMNRAALSVMEEFRDIILSYGQSDEYSFVFNKKTLLYNRRSAKIMTNVNSLFTSSYVYNWNSYFGDQTLSYPPSFDARAVLYPTDQNLRDYLSWRQADVHVNNLYNTAFWNLVLNANLTNAKAEERLRGTLAADKNEILFSEFNINYNNVPAMFRKGTILLRKQILDEKNNKQRQIILPFHTDMIQEKFWREHSEILALKGPQLYSLNEDNICKLVSEQLMREKSVNKKQGSL